MTTFINDTRISHLQTYPSALEYVTLTGNVSRNGNTVTLSNLSVTVRVTVAYSAYGETQNYYIAQSASGGAIAQTGNFEFDFSDGPDHTETHAMGDVSFTVSASDSQATLYLRAFSNEDAQIPFTVSFPVPPTGLNVVVKEIYSDGAKFDAYVSTWGTPSGASGRWIEAGLSDTNSWRGNLRSTKVLNSDVIHVTVDNSSTATQTLTIYPNTFYYYGGYAWNTEIDISGMFGDLVTLPEPPSTSIVSVGTSTAVLAYTTLADGGYYDKDLEYSIDGGVTWTTAATITGGSAQTGIFNVTNLPSNIATTILARLTTPSGSSLTTSISVTPIGAPNGLYGSVNGFSKRVDKLYGSAVLSVSSWAFHSSTTGSALNSFDPNAFIEKIRIDLGAEAEKILPRMSQIRFYGHRTFYTVLPSYVIGFSDDSCSDEIDITLTELQQYGVDISWGTRVYNSVLVDVTPFSQSVEIEKLYGPSPKQLVSLNLDTSATYTLVTNIDEPTFIAKYNSWVQGDGAGIFYKDEIYQINIYHNITGSDNYYNFYLTGKLPANPLVDRAYSISMNGNMNTVLAAAQEWGITFTSSSTKVNDTLAVTPEYGCSAKLIYESAKES